MSENPLLSKLNMPGATFKLPSCGLFYTSGEITPDVVDGEVHVQPMTGYDELLLKSPDMLFSGQGVNKVKISAMGLELIKEFEGFSANLKKRLEDLERERAKGAAP